MLDIIGKNDKIISTTGYTSRELHQIRIQNNCLNGKDFYMVGGMGHTISVALGCSINSKNKIVCLDGDGSLLMHMGAAATVANYAKHNFRYILLNNNSHESVGGQTTNSKNINFKTFSKSVGFKNYYIIDIKKNIKNILLKFLEIKGPSFLEVRIKTQSMNNLKRPKNLLAIRNSFML